MILWHDWDVQRCICSSAFNKSLLRKIFQLFLSHISENAFGILVQNWPFDKNFYFFVYFYA